MFGDMKEKLKNAGEKAKESAGALKEGTDGILKKVTASSMAEIEGLRPILNKSGFIIGDIIIEMTLTPSVTLIVERHSEGEVLFDESLEKEVTTLQATILSSIRKIYQLNAIVEEHNHTIGQVEVVLGLPPTVRAHLNSMDSKAFSSSV
jgi:hypothetical protein